jgi:hypothetical protein
MKIGAEDLQDAARLEDDIKIRLTSSPPRGERAVDFQPGVGDRIKPWVTPGNPRTTVYFTSPRMGAIDRETISCADLRYKARLSSRLNYQEYQIFENNRDKFIQLLQINGIEGNEEYLWERSQVAACSIARIHGLRILLP